MDKQYWENYYALSDPAEQPSDFARFCAKEYKKENGKIFDIGCGNGRDTLFFSSCSIPCAGIDQCETATAKNKVKGEKLGLTAEFFQDDFSNCDYDAMAEGTYCIYSRFTLHAISYEEENQLFRHLNQVKKLSKIFIEARSIRDGIYGQGRKVGLHEYVTTHYRRFIDPIVLRSRLEESFTIEYFNEAQGLAKTPTEDPCLVRLIAVRR